MERHTVAYGKKTFLNLLDVFSLLVANCFCSNEWNKNISVIMFPSLPMGSKQSHVASCMTVFF